MTGPLEHHAAKIAEYESQVRQLEQRNAATASELRISRDSEKALRERVAELEASWAALQCHTQRDDSFDCYWHDRATTLDAQLAASEARVAALEGALREYDASLAARKHGDVAAHAFVQRARAALSSGGIEPAPDTAVAKRVTARIEARVVELEGALREARVVVAYAVTWLPAAWQVKADVARATIDEALAAAVLQPPCDSPVCSVAPVAHPRTPSCPAVPQPPGVQNGACPECAKPHWDEGEWATRPHRTHRCVDDRAGHGCGHEWGPAVQQGEPDAYDSDPMSKAYREKLRGITNEFFGEPTPATQRSLKDEESDEIAELEEAGRLAGWRNPPFVREAPPAGEPTPASAGGDYGGCANCGCPADVKTGYCVHEGDGEWTCSRACHDMLDELGCPFEVVDGLREQLRRAALIRVQMLAAQPAPASSPRDESPLRSRLEKLAAAWEESARWIDTKAGSVWQQAAYELCESLDLPDAPTVSREVDEAAVRASEREAIAAAMLVDAAVFRSDADNSRADGHDVWAAEDGARATVLKKWAKRIRSGDFERPAASGKDGAT